MKTVPYIIQFSVKLNNVIFPLDFTTFNRTLSSSGFLPVRVGQQLPNQLVITEFDIATKNNVVVTLNAQTMFIGIAGTKPDDMINIFHELDPILSKSGVKLNKDGRFYELLAEYLVEDGGHPMNSIQNFYTPLKSIEQFDKIMDSKSSLFGLRIIPKDSMIDSENYYEVRVEPLVPRLDSAYYVSFTYRNKDRIKTENFTVQIEDKIKSIINSIEKS